MPSRIQSLRRRAFERQHGLCCYCHAPMWLSSPAELPARAPTAREAGRLLCTAEHLTARADGGRNNSGNIAAACLHCNRTRHRRKRPPDVDQYREEVSKRMARRGWHPDWVHIAIRHAVLLLR
jgi:5-methylcytosine-specific restriction endonuclease McrA